MMANLFKYPNMLFAYGLLRKASDHDMSLYLRNHADYLGNGYIHGTLYLIDHYPGAMIDCTSSSKIIGDIFGFNDPLLWSELDRFEEVDSSDEYLREVVDVHFNQKILKCWVYTYKNPVNGLTAISSGDFIDYINTKQGK